MAITKTDFLRGMQCRKMLWLDKHRPGLRVIPPETQARLDAGNDFGDRAMAMLSRGVPVICEAAFSNYNNYCAADILRRTETGYDLYEVKNAPEVREQFIRDAGFQYYIISRCGVRIGRVFIVLHGPDGDNPFLPVDVTREARACYPWINDHIWDLNRMQKEPKEVEAEPGEQCSHPYECWYYGYCHGLVREPEQLCALPDEPDEPAE